MSFKSVAYEENERIKGDLTETSKRRLMDQTKFYILLQDIKERISGELAPDERVEGYLALTLQGNSAVMNAGIMGMAYAKTEAARDYVDTFHDVRGNRLMIFTNTRMIFLTVVEFLEDNTYFSYPYDTIHSIYLKQREDAYLDTNRKTKKFKWYFLDFQSGERVYDEVLNEQDVQIFMEMWEKIPAMKKIPRGKTVWRKNTLDRIMSNVNLALQVTKGINWLAIGAAVAIYGGFAIYLIWKYALGH